MASCAASIFMMVVMAAAFASAESDSHCDAEVCGQSSKGDSGSHALLQVRADGTATKVHHVEEKPGSTSATLDSATALKDAATAIKTSLAAATTKAEASEEGEAIQKILAKASEEGKAKDGEKKEEEKKDDEPAAEEKKEKKKDEEMKEAEVIEKKVEKKDEEMKEAEVQRPRPTRKKRRKSSNSGKQTGKEDQSGQDEPEAKSSESGDTDASGHDEPDAEDVPADTDNAPADGKDDADNHDTAPKEGKDAGQADLGEAGEVQSKAIADEEADGEGSDDTNEVLIEQGMKIFPEGTRP